MDASTGGGSAELRPRTIGEILQAAFDLYREHWQSLFQIVAVVVVPLTLIQYVLTEVALRQSTRSIEEAETLEELIGAVEGAGSSFGRAILINLVVALIGVLMWQLLVGAITRAAAGSVAGMPVAVGEAFSYALARIGPILLVGFLVAVIVGVGFILLVIPGIFFLVKLAVAMQSLIIEDKRGTEPLSRSWQLTSGHFWHVIGTVVVAAIIAGIVSSIIGGIFGAGGWFLGFIGSSIGQIVTQPFAALVGVLLYLDLRVRKENLDTATLRSEMGGGGMGGGGMTGGFSG